MRRLIGACLLMLCLSVAVFAGHTLQGGWCDCGSPGCICEPGETSQSSRASVSNETSQGKPAALGAETLFVLAALFLVLRYKA